MVRKLYLYAALAGLLACNQTDKQEVQEQFRKRQQTTQRQAEDSPAEMPPATPATTSADQPAARNNATTAGGDKVVAVKDGDTIELLRNGQTIKVRLYGVDSPEKVQDYGQRARQFTSDLAFGKTVRLIAHNTDRYGRTVGTIILPDGRNLNEELVKNGYAWHYKAYSKDKNLANLEADARRYKRGLWAAPNPTPPWDFRRDKRESAAEKKAAKATAALPAGATKRTVYICNSTGSGVYHTSKNCSVLKRCKADVLTITEAAAIREYDRRADKTCAR